MWRRLTFLSGLGLAMGGFVSIAAGQGRVVITEVMYNPASDERRGEPEWVEIANVGDATVTLRNWRLDDEDRRNWGAFSCTLAPGGVAVLCNQKYAGEAMFRSAWDTPREEAKPAYQVLPVKWGGLANTPSMENEILHLLDDRGRPVCEVNLRHSGDWPKVNGVSIYLSDITTDDVNTGIVWKASAAGTDGALACNTNEVFNKPDVGSPGVLPRPISSAASANTLAIPEESIVVTPLPIAPARPVANETSPPPAQPTAVTPTDISETEADEDTPPAEIKPDVIIPY